MGSTSRDVQPSPSPESPPFGWPLYPVAPLSWLAPLWAYICGVAASGGWSWNSASLMRLLLGMLLAGPLLVLAWASVQHLVAGSGSAAPWRLGLTPAGQTDGASARETDAAAGGGGADARLADEPPGEHVAAVTSSLPYTLRGSASDRVAIWLSGVREGWNRTESQRRRSIVQLMASTLFGLVVAAQLRGSVVALTVVVFGLLCSLALVLRRWAASVAVSTTLPLLAAWLLGHATFTVPSPASAATGAAFAAALSSGRMSARGNALAAWQVVAQLVVAGLLVYARQPIAASVVALLALSALLLVSLLDAPESRPSYFAALQLQYTVGMLVAGLALGYRP